MCRSQDDIGILMGIFPASGGGKQRAVFPPLGQGCMEWQRWGPPAMETGRAGWGPWKQILRQSFLCKRFITKVCPAFHCGRISEDASPQDLPDTAGGVQTDATTLENNLAVSHGGEYSAIPLPDACLETTSSSLVSDVCSL
ncbi:uncharacterized protein [Symphalangus syndactylus]|uniref:uncharacterized protein n=1 Tax=Symphalangus syndactylus TaxID=9590 RepID=UPI0024432CB1|nr:uncharacterized protein LOC129474868 [Symphalangus syndactylus]